MSKTQGYDHISDAPKQPATLVLCAYRPTEPFFKHTNSEQETQTHTPSTPVLLPIFVVPHQLHRRPLLYGLRSTLLIVFRSSQVEHRAKPTHVSTKA